MGLSPATAEAAVAITAARPRRRADAEEGPVRRRQERAAAQARPDLAGFETLDLECRLHRGPHGLIRNLMGADWHSFGDSYDERSPGTTLDKKDRTCFKLKVMIIGQRRTDLMAFRGRSAGIEADFEPRPEWLAPPVGRWG